MNAKTNEKEPEKKPAPAAPANETKKPEDKKTPDAPAPETAAKPPAPKEEKPVELAKETLTGDLRDAMLQVIRDQKEVWSKLPELSQRGVVDNVTQRAEYLVAQAIRLIRAEGRKTIAGNLESVQIKDNVKATVTFSKSDEQISDVYAAQGMAVLMVVSDKSEFTGERARPRVTPDQKNLLEKDIPVADKGKNIPQAKDKEVKKPDAIPGGGAANTATPPVSAGTIPKSSVDKLKEPEKKPDAKK